MLTSLTRRLVIPVQSAETLVFSCDRTRFFKFVSAVVVSQAAFFAIASEHLSSKLRNRHVTTPQAHLLLKFATAQPQANRLQR